MCGTSQPLISALIKLNKENLSELEPPKIYSMFNYSHPPLMERIKALEKAAGRVELQLPDERYKLVAEKCNTMPGHEEIDIIIEDQFGNVVQDIARVQPKVVELTPGKVFHDKNHVTAYLYEDECDEE